MQLNFCGQAYSKRSRSATQFILAMKLTVILVTIVCLQTTAHTYAQKISMVKRNIPLSAVLEEVKKQSGYSLFYDNTLVDQAGATSVNIKDLSVGDALNEILKDQPFSFTIISKTIVIKQKDPALLDRIKTALVVPIAISGQVVDTTGTGLPGASVTLKGTSFTTKTDDKGLFQFASVPEGSYTLVVSYIGFSTIEKAIKAQSSGDIHQYIMLHYSSSPLDQVQIIGYGTESKRFSVGSVATVTAETIEKQPVTNVLLAMEGQVAGLSVNATSGVPGSTVLVQVRGQNTLGINSTALKPYDQPLFIVDGVPFASQNNNVSQLSSLALQQSYTGGISQPGGISPFNNLNPNDIESISILKDADATSIYGSQGSNGVVIITTKKGKPGKTAVNVNVNTGFSSDAHPVKLLNLQQYLQVRNDAFTADGVKPSSDPNNYQAYAPDLTLFDQNKNTDWQKKIYGQNSSNTNVHASISGGTYNSTYIVSTGYSNSDYDFPGKYADQKLTLHSALHNTSNDKKFTMDLVMDYGYDQNNSPAFGGGNAILLPPNTPNLLDGNGNLLWSYNGIDLTSYQYNTYVKEPTNLQNYNLNGALQLSYKILPGLSISTNLGYSRNTTNEHSENPASAQSPSFKIVTAAFDNMINQTINIEPQINYTKTFGKGMLSALVGGSYKKNTGYTSSVYGTGYTNDNLLGSIDGAATISTTDNSAIYKYVAAFARLKYIYDQKYIVDLTGRRDGSSNFGPNNQFGNFGSVGAGWIFSEEKLIKDDLKFLSYGKLSASYGTTGSDGVEAYNYQQLYKAIGSSVPFQGVKQSYPYNLYNPNYSWALKKSLNLSLDLGFFNNRLLLNGTYYRDRENNQLVNYPLPIQTGFAKVTGNLDASVQNKGLELTATSTNIKTKDFSWSTNFNVTSNRNKLLSFPNLTSSSYSGLYVIGQPTSIIFGYRYKDVNPTTGLFEFYKANGQVTSAPTFGLASAGGDEVPIANQEVKYMGGFGNNFTYKNFGLYIFCQYSSQNAPNYLQQVYQNYPVVNLQNLPAAILGNYWMPNHTDAPLQRLASSYSSTAISSSSYFYQSTAAYSNDTYLRVKTVALSYTLPSALLQKIHVQSAKIYVNAQNLFTLTNYKVGDPEQFNYVSFPLQRTLAFGLNLNF
jgi:TonB-linked SusC/RagA family outer membrane protein